MLLVVALAFTVGGCGGVVGESGTTRSATPAADELLPAPAVEPVDRPAEPGALMTHEDLARDSSTYSVCQVQIATGSSGTAAAEQSGGDCKVTDAERAEMRAEERAYRESIAPAEGTKPRTVAELKLGDDRRIELAAWRTASDRLCMEAATWNGRAGGRAGPFGECVPASDCTTSLCAEELPRGTGGGAALVAVVASDADRIEITTEDGERRAYRLSGPLVPGSPERVFMVDLGDGTQRAIDVYRGDERIGHSEKSASVLAFEACARNVASPPMTVRPAAGEMREWDRRLQDCMREHGGGAPATTTTG